MITNNDILNFLGLARRAGKLVLGREQCLAAVRKKKAKLVVLAGNAAYLTRKEFTDKCRYYGVPLFETGTKEEIGKALGKQPLSVIAFIDESFAAGLLKRLQGN
ncbi:MAG TPA: 50S ribosomal protein L7ae [Firmicutes bacterium]|nr:50S ribosomal protein L7ae [Bacillota bacterium]